MAKKSKVEAVRKFLQDTLAITVKEQAVAVSAERFHDAETYKSFRNVLGRAIELCGEEKPKEAKNE